MGNLTQLIGLPPRSHWRQRFHELAPQMVVVVFLLLVAAAVGVATILLPNSLRLPFIFLTALITIILWRNEPFDLLVIFTVLVVFSNGGTLRTPQMIYEPLEYLGYFIFLLFLFHRWVSRTKPWLLTPLDLPIIIFVLTIIVNAIYSLWIGNLFTNVLRESLMYPRFLLIYYMTVNVLTNRERLNNYLQILLIMLIFLASYGLYQYFFGGIEVTLKGYGIGGRIYSTFGNANLYSGLLELCLPVLFSYFLSAKDSKQRLMLGSLTLLVSLNAILTFSRGALGGIIAAVMILTILRSRQRALVLVILFILIIVLATTTSLLTRQLALVFSTNEVRSEYTIIHRVEQYSGYIKTFMANPVFGVGWGSYAKTTASGVFVRSRFEIFEFGHLNGAYFDFLVHEGVIGALTLLVLMASIVTVFARAGKRFKAHPDAALQWGLFAGALAFFVHQLMDNFLKWSQVNAMFWIIIGVGIAAQQIHINEEHPLPKLGEKNNQ